MATLKVRGIHSSDTASEYSSDEVGTIDDTFLFPKWWDKKANNVEYIRCFKMHMERVCDDIDVIIPANADVEIRGAYDGNLSPSALTTTVVLSGWQSLLITQRKLMLSTSSRHARASTA